MYSSPQSSVVSVSSFSPSSEEAFRTPKRRLTFSNSIRKFEVITHDVDMFKTKLMRKHSMEETETTTVLPMFCLEETEVIDAPVCFEVFQKEESSSASEQGGSEPIESPTVALH